MERWSDEILAKFKGLDALEIGALDGMTSVYLSKYFRRVFVIDPWDGRQQGVPEKYNIFLNNTKNYSNIFHCRTGSETQEAKNFLANIDDFQLEFCFIDGFHTADFVINDFLLSEKYVINEGEVWVDDCDHGPVNDGAKFIEKRTDYEEKPHFTLPLSVWNDSITYLRVFKKKI